MVEEWRAVVESSYYEVSSLGRVKALPRSFKRPGKRIHSFQGGILTINPNFHGYPVVGIWTPTKNNVRPVHRLVAFAFIPNPENLPCVNHIDGDKTNNTVGNLEWVSYADNNNHAFGLRLRSNFGESSSQRKIDDSDALSIKLMYEEGVPSKMLASLFQMTKENIDFIGKDITWNHLIQ